MPRAIWSYDKFISHWKFARMCGVSVSTLRNWERIGLIRLHRVGESNGYRYYQTCQLRQVYMIRALQSIGIPNYKILEWLSYPLNIELLEKQECVIEQSIQQLGYLDNIQYYKNSLYYEYKVEVKSLPEQCALIYRGVFPDVPSIVDQLNCMRRRVSESEGGADKQIVSIGQYFDDEINIQNQINAILYVGVTEPDLYAPGEIGILLSVPKAVTVRHKGYYRFLGDAYIEAFQFMEDHGFQVKGVPREWYIRDSWQIGKDEEQYVTEIQIPVE